MASLTGPLNVSHVGEMAENTRTPITQFITCTTFGSGKFDTTAAFSGYELRLLF